jgi:hypothetical protein
MRGEGRRRIALTLVALLFFGGPALAGLLGERAGGIENRTLTPFPSLAQGWAFFPHLSQWATDHLPLRDRAVRANSAASEWAFNELPATAGSPPPVILGRDGWLFFSGDTFLACQNRARLSGVNRELERFAALTGRLGKRLVTTVGPDKTTIETDRLPERYPNRDCSLPAKAELWQRLAADPPPGYVDLRVPLERAKQQYGAVYKPQDTHFDDHGNVAFATALAAALDPRMVDHVELQETGPRSTIGDLSVLTGLPAATTFPGVTLHRPGVVVTRTDTIRSAMPIIHSSATSTGAPLVPGRTLLVGDSYSLNGLAWLQPFFADLDFLLLSTPAAPAAFAELLRSADTVILEQVERTFVQCNTPLLAADFLAPAG